MEVRNLLGPVATFVVACVLLVPARCAADEPVASPPAPVAKPPEPTTDSLRLAIRPSWAHSFLPGSVSAEGIGLGLDLFPGRPLARGRLGFSLVGAFYGPFSRDEPEAPSAFPLTETLGFINVEARGIVMNRHAFQLDVFAGNGVIWTRPVSLVDPARRHFEFGNRLDFSAGAALSVRLARGVHLTIEGRDLIYIDQREAPVVAARRADSPDTWLGDKPLKNMVEARVGFTFLLFPGPS